jgi:hypothetical protein
MKPTSPDAEILDGITRAVALAAKTAFGEGTKLVSPAPERIDRRYSFIFNYRFQTCNNQNHILQVKIPHEAWMGTLQESVRSAHLGEVVSDEYHRLTSIAYVISQTGRADLFALRPLALFPQYNAFLMERISLRMLKAYLPELAVILGSNKAWRKFEKDLRLSGEWLQVIHAHFADLQSGTPASLKLDGIWITELKNLEGRLGRPLETLRDSFHQLYMDLRDEPVPLSGLHNDYQLGNIFVTPSGQVGALDPNWEEAGPIYHDLATLLTDPVSRRAGVFSWGLSFRQSLRRRYELAVLTGYFGSSRSAPPLLDFFCALTVLSKWRIDEEFLDSTRSNWYGFAIPIIRRWIRPYFQRLIRHYLLKGQNAVRAHRQPPD